MTAKARTVICLLRNDLRVHDNEALLWAHRNGEHIVPLYCFDPDHAKGTWHFNFPKTGKHRQKFILESVVNLRENLRKVDCDLVIENARPVESIKKLVEACQKLSKPVVAVVYQKEVTFEELIVEKAIKDYCKSQGVTVTEIWGSTLFHQQDLPFKSVAAVPDTYTQFRKEVEARSKVRPVLTMPAKLKPLPPGLATEDPASLEVESSSPDPRTAFPFPGGESSALARLQHYLWGSHAVATYKETRNGLVGQDYSTKFSPWLALGCLSPRMIHSEVKRYEKDEVANKSTYWVIFELLWRDYFKFVCLKFGDRVFHRAGILGKDLPWSQDMGQFRAWAEGRTGVPWVDANMRELRLTGWMSNRGRQNVASFLLKDLGLDWRLGAEWFESLLLDHDVCSNYGNWNYAAGIGNDPREDRKFNMVKQAMDYDCEGEFARLWLEELRGVKGGRVHVPWTLSQAELERAGVELGVDYPKPLVVAPEWSRHQGGKAGKGQGPPPGQRGVQDFFKPGEKPRSGGAKKPLPRGGRVQY